MEKIIWYYRVRNEVVVYRDKEERNIMDTMKRRKPIVLLASAVESAL